MRQQDIDTLGAHIAQTAMEAAARFMLEEGLEPTEQVFTKIVQAMRSRVRQMYPVALKNSKQVLDAGMEYGAVVMMDAGFALAGIKAVQDVMCWSGCTCQWCTGVVN